VFLFDSRGAQVLDIGIGIGIGIGIDVWNQVRSIAIAAAIFRGSATIARRVRAHDNETSNDPAAASATARPRHPQVEATTSRAVSAHCPYLKLKSATGPASGSRERSDEAECQTWC